ncbi:hypothetical protein BRADI_1g26746v3 [Brachypodium distachyon]|uniref:TFIIB-type domain-containing protein n=1 Tax=Brachypodium distachyon TaxID=15368 RepID=A0A0Q3H091_BRADI|nr:hypothetical protein BRADI_1g26746v3 [Brachypodium distachyon]
MYDVANGLRYCKGCRRVTTVTVDPASGDTVCTECSLVLNERYVEESTEWRSFLNHGAPSDESRSRVGDPADHFFTNLQFGNAVAGPAPGNAQTNKALPRMRGSSAGGSGVAMPKTRGAAEMYDVAHSLHYCKGCRRVTAITVDPSSGDTVCTECSLVLNERYVDESFEWRTFLNHGAPADESRRRVGDPIAGPAPGDAQTNTALPRKRGGGAGGSCVAKPKTRGAAATAALDRALADAFHAMDGMAERLGLATTVKDRAKDVLRKLEVAKVFRKGGKCRNRQALYAACLLMACRGEGTQLTFKELASVTGDSATAGIKDTGRLAAALEMGAVVRAGDYLHRFGSLLGMGQEELHAAQQAARRLEKDLDVRRNPGSIAAAVIYMAVERANAGKSIRDVSTATGVGEVTIRDVYNKDLSPHADLLFG